MFSNDPLNLLFSFFPHRPCPQSIHLIPSSPMFNVLNHWFLVAKGHKSYYSITCKPGHCSYLFKVGEGKPGSEFAGEHGFASVWLQESHEAEE